MSHNTSHTFSYRMLGALLALILLIPACAVLTNASAPAATQPEPAAATAIPAASSALSSTSTSVPEPAVVEQITPSVVVDASGLAQAVASLVLPAAAGGADAAWWGEGPEYTVFWLYNYLISDHTRQPQIFVYKVEDLNVNEAAARAAQDLQALLQTQQPGDRLPYLPLTGDIQALHAQVKYLDFKNGKGMRFLTQLNNGMAPINNHGLFYTFQGLAGDGRYYVAAVLPVYLSSLPMFPNEIANLPLEFTDDYPTYIAGITNQLNLEPDGNYMPDLSKLDTMIQSIEVR